MRDVARKLPPRLATLLVVSFLTFLLTSLLPGDPAVQVLGPQSATPEAIAKVRADLRLDDPLTTRYVAWLGDVASGDLGRSYRTAQEVRGAIAERLPVTVPVGGLAIVIARTGTRPPAMVLASPPG